MDDWQDVALSTRHMHNRVGRNGRGSEKSKRDSVFDVRKTFGSYSCKCPAWHRISSASDQAAALEVYRLTENGQGVVGQLSLPSVLHAAVILAASRESLGRILSALQPVGQDDHIADGGEVQRRTDVDEHHSGSDNAGHDHGQSDTECYNSDDNNSHREFHGNDAKNRFDTFEKNSFRSPKFWLQWNGTLQSTSTHETGLGYIVFNSNDCRKFKGTINCTSLDWKNVSFSGHKVCARTESDVPVTWGVDQILV
jgi:hypothetical protein